MVKAPHSIDDLVRASIGQLFPDQSIPDENNFRPDGTQYKAPDHAVLSERVLIERKSRNPTGGQSVYEKLRAIAASQGAPFHGFGKLNTASIISSLPDPDTANRQMVDFLLGQTLIAVRKAKKKFSEYDAVKGVPGQIRMLVISDNSDIHESTAAIEQFLGRKMGGYDRSHDVTGLIDAVLFVKDPRFTIDEENSYWFKVLAKGTLQPDDFRLVGNIAGALHDAVATAGDFKDLPLRFRHGRFRMLRA